MKFILAVITAIAISFSSATFAEVSPPLTQQDCIALGEMAYNIATARDMGVSAEEVLEAITSSNGEPTSEELAAFTEFVNGIYADEDSPEVLGVAIIQSCLTDAFGN